MLPVFKDDNLNLMLMQTKWKSDLDPIIKNSLLSGFAINGTHLANGVTVINHLLSRMMVGWFITDVNAAATIYRSQPLNNKTLTLTSNAACIVNLWVF